MKIVSINGLDGIGKTEQIRLLSSEKVVNCLGSLSAYSDRWPKLGPVEIFNWWFRDVSCSELFSIIIESIKARASACKPDKLNINDRGALMFKAVCAATLLTREETSSEQVIERIDALFEKELGDTPLEEEILLRPSPEYKARVQNLLKNVNDRSDGYLPWQVKLYAEYQVKLAVLMDHYFRDIKPNRVITVDSCIIDVQNKLRAILGEVYGVVLLKVCDTLEKLVAFGGMSESGKSSFAEHLSNHHGYHRFKIKYFEGVVKSRDGKSRPDTLGIEILEFLSSHRHITHATIESLHGVDLPSYLKLMLGHRMTTVFLDTPEAIRVRRTAQTLGLSVEQALEDTRAKDAIKTARGGDKVRDIADIVFDNSCDDFHEVLKAFVNCL